MKQKRNVMLAVAFALFFVLGLSGSALAFQDLNNVPGKEKIEALREAGIISGVDALNFNPHGNLTYAQAVPLIVEGIDLKADVKSKKPKGSDYFQHVPDDAWYAPSFIIARLNGLDIPDDVDPNRGITREEYAHLLAEAMWTKGDFAFIEIWMIMADEKDVNPAYMNNIQKLLIANVAQLDSERRFRPKDVITRAEAAVMLSNARQFVADYLKRLGDNSGKDSVQEGNVTMRVDKVTDDVDK
jgi:hypothetical protein